MICVVVLQNCMCCVEGETGSCSETCVTCDFDATDDVSINVEEAIDIKEEISIKVEEAVDIKDEIPEDIIFPPIKTEQEVSLWGVCEEVAAHAFKPFISPKIYCGITLHCFLLCVLFRVPYSFKICIATPKGRDFL